jgi:hypothetical protein
MRIFALYGLATVINDDMEIHLLLIIGIQPMSYSNYSIRSSEGTTLESVIL